MIAVAALPEERALGSAVASITLDFLYGGNVYLSFHKCVYIISGPHPKLSALRQGGPKYTLWGFSPPGL